MTAENSTLSDEKFVLPNDEIAGRINVISR